MVKRSPRLNGIQVRGGKQATSVPAEVGLDLSPEKSSLASGDYVGMTLIVYLQDLCSQSQKYVGREALDSVAEL